LFRTTKRSEHPKGANKEEEKKEKKEVTAVVEIEQIKTPSPDDVQAAMTPRGGWTRAQLAVWGVAWPPPKGWRKLLREQWQQKEARIG
jgi:hypothetical protein